MHIIKETTILKGGNSRHFSHAGGGKEKEGQKEKEETRPAEVRFLLA